MGILQSEYQFTWFVFFNDHKYFQLLGDRQLHRYHPHLNIVILFQHRGKIYHPLAYLQAIGGLQKMEDEGTQG